MTFEDQFARQDPNLRGAIQVMASNAGFIDMRNEPDAKAFCEALAVAARLGEISLRTQPAEAPK